jgi:DNA polymerase-3 subunit alpha
MAANMHRDYADRKNGRQPITYLHPDLEPILADTYGLMIYQESVMRVAQKFAGYSLEEADNLRKAAGKKVRSIMAEERHKFVDGCVAQGYSAELGTKLFDIIEPFADYAFNKSHSYGYGYVSYQTAWLKANYPVEYFAALLTSVKDDKEKTAVYLSECRRLGIEVTVPDVNLSVADFTPLPAEHRIVFGMASVRNVGEAQVERIVAARAASGPFTDFYDFCSRVDATALNKRTVESLIKAGAFDSLGHPRGGLLAAYTQIVDLAVARQREQQAGITSLFTDPSSGGPLINPADAPIPNTDTPKPQRLAAEKDMLGLYISDHPLRGYENALARHTDYPISVLHKPGQIDNLTTRGQIRLGGVITALNRKFTKRGDQMATFTLEDLDSSVEVVVFPRTLAEVDELLVSDTVVVVTGRVDRHGENRVQFMCMSVEQPALAAPTDTEFHVALPDTVDDTTLDRLRQILADHPGTETVYLTMGATTVRLPHNNSVDSSHGLPGAVRALLGPTATTPKTP